MKILVTGGCGMIGSHIVDALILQGHQITIIDNLSTGNLKNLNSKAQFFQRDITEDITDIFSQNFDLVFHFAAQINLRDSIKNPIKDAEINIMGSLNVLEQCRKTKVKKIIFSSTGGAIYSPTSIRPCFETSLTSPSSPYGLSKLTIENYLNLYYELYGLNFVCLRFANVYGPRQNSHGEAGVISIFVDKALKGEIGQVFGSGLATRDFVFVHDVVDACLLCIDKIKIGTFNVSSKIETSVNDLVDLIGKSIGKFEIKYLPAIPGELMRSCLSYDLLKQTSGWSPRYDLCSGIFLTIEHFKTLK